MDEEKEAQKQQQKQEEQDSTKKALKTGAKAAANAYAGPVGGAAVDLASKTKLGSAALDTGAKVLNKSPGVGKIANIANKTGALDAADKAVGSAGGASNVASGKIPTSSGQSSAAPTSKSPSILNNTKTSKPSSKNEETEVEGLGESRYSAKIFSFIRDHKLLFISIFGGFLLFIFCIVLIITIIGTPLSMVTNFFSGIADTIVGFFGDDEQDLMNKYYNTLADVQASIHELYDVCIDVNLITAALTVNVAVDDFLEDGKEIVDDGIDNPNYDPDSEDPNNKPTLDVSYEKMIKQVKILANMQLITKKYDIEYSNGSYCSASEETNLITAGSKNSSTFELIASHDMNGIQAFFTSKSNEEQNNAYYIYRPPFDSDGTCTRNYAENKLPSDHKELSIGDLSTMKDSVFYWNLVNSFIPVYYNEYLPSSGEKRTEAIKKIAEDIYLLYNESGPSQTCSVSYAGPSNLCPNGIMVEGVGTLELEEYVAGVVSNEAYASEGMEALKAQAVAARTYALKSTDFCQKSITNSTNQQTFTKDINDRAREAVNATLGEVLVDKDGKIFSANYDSFCYDDEDCPDATRNSDGTYTVTYTKVPYGEKHTITLNDPSQYGRILPGQGHALGMSQLVSYQLAKEGKNYQEILSYFYSDGVEIRLVLSPTVTDGSKIIQGPITNYLASVGSSVESFNQYIYDQVKKSGVGTREGVVAAATSLVSGFYSQTGYILPYELYPSGKYSGYGIDLAWGHNTGRSDYPLQGLDCSGFISWAVHNGGFAYEIKNAVGWGNAGAKRAWGKGMVDSSARPGDLIYNAPASENGTSGHIRMIVGVTNEGYVVAEASSRKNGIRIVTVPFQSTGSYYLVDMSSYYANATRVTDYPM